MSEGGGYICVCTILGAIVFFLVIGASTSAGKYRRNSINRFKQKVQKWKSFLNEKDNTSWVVSTIENDSNVLAQVITPVSLTDKEKEHISTWHQALWIGNLNISNSFINHNNITLYIFDDNNWNRSGNIVLTPLHQTRMMSGSPNCMKQLEEKDLVCSIECKNNYGNFSYTEKKVYINPNVKNEINYDYQCYANLSLIEVCFQFSFDDNAFTIHKYCEYPFNRRPKKKYALVNYNQSYALSVTMRHIFDPEIALMKETGRTIQGRPSFGDSAAKDMENYWFLLPFGIICFLGGICGSFCWCCENQYCCVDQEYSKKKVSMQPIDTVEKQKRNDLLDNDTQNK